MKKKYIFMILCMCLLFFCAQSVEAKTTKKTYKIVYHYSASNTSKKVTKTYKVGSHPKLYTPKGLKWSYSKSSLFLGWSSRLKSTGKWKLYSGNSSKWGTYSKANLYIQKVQTPLKEKVKNKDEIHLYGQWQKTSNIPVTLKCFHANGYAANGKDKKDDTKAIQNALDLSKGNSQKMTLTIPEGTYYISSPLHVYGDTTLKLTKNTKIVADPNLHKKGTVLYVGQTAKTRSGGYKQARNVTVDGGIWDGDFGKKGDSGVLRFNHCENITVKNVVIQNYTGRHAILFAGVKNGTIQDCLFQDHKTDVPGSSIYNASLTQQGTAEAVHIDTTSIIGEPTALPIDNTICENILIQRCTFDNVLAGIGNHVESPSNQSESLKIFNNDFRNVKYYCLNIYNRLNVEVKGNKVHYLAGEEYFIREYNSTFKIKQQPIMY